MPEKEFPTIEYPKDRNELIIRQWDRILRIASSGGNPIEPVDWIEVALSDKIDNPIDGRYKEMLKEEEKKYEKALEKLAGRLNIPKDELDIMQMGMEKVNYYKKKSRILWKLTVEKGTFGEKSVKGVLDENVVEAISKSTDK